MAAILSRPRCVKSCLYTFRGSTCGMFPIASRSIWGSPGEGAINTLRPRQNGRHVPDDIFKCIFLNENVRILIKISLNFVPNGPMNNNPASVQIMAWRRIGDKPLSEPMIVNLRTHICVTRSQWVKAPCANFSVSDIYIQQLYFLNPFKHVIIWQMLSQLSCCNTCQIWRW